MGIRLIKISAVYFLLGVSVGYYMSTAHMYNLTGVHAHLNLLGWTALTLIGLIYVVFPELTNNISAKIHFWLHNIGLPVMMVALFIMLQTGNMDSTPLIAGTATGATLVLVGVLFFVYNILFNLKGKTK
ncbi:cbb3-type cytochrome oxidase subunit 1 [Salirhabdus euzebyi]|uniref:Cbb3-type cytochrome oxidase subunit 1 n=1 Tax=Salirhabdus euzebyi TaxID=394506 RepID=A0A841PTI2_9BACI|nr:cytochrome-c oxidase [Salirhabdus euzebyi]MBB6452297.1 cbb3-type cytochrome oxidase subunit 1 [Salirhabdus euzebyi]